MKQRKTSVTMVFSLVLCLLIAVLWVRSYWRCDEFNMITHDFWHFDGSHYGKIAFVRQRLIPPGGLKPHFNFHTTDYAQFPNFPRNYRFWSPYTYYCDPLYEHFGFILGVRPPGVRGTKTSGFVIAIPYWFISRFRRACHWRQY